MAKIIQKEIDRLRKTLEEIPRNKRFALGGKGIMILSKIHKLEIEKERLGGLKNA